MYATKHEKEEQIVMNFFGTDEWRYYLDDGDVMHDVLML